MKRLSRTLTGALLACSAVVAGPATTGHAGTPDGNTIYTANCKACHAMQPPARTAPPIVALAGRYRAVHGNKADAVKAMVAFMKKPDAAKSVLGPQAVKRFGLMPAMALPDDQLATVSGWLWDQYDPNFDSRGNCK